MKISMRTVAHEWLVLLSCVAFSLLAPPVVVTLLTPGRSFHEIVWGYWTEAVFVGWGSALLVLLVPYGVVQLVRSVVWAVRERLRGKPGDQ